MFDAYGWAHFVHLALAAIWIGVIARADAAIGQIGSARDEAGRRARFKVARGFTLGMEMPVVTAVIVVGFVMAIINPGVFRQGWFHVKLLLAIVLVITFVLTAIRQRQIGDVLGEDQLGELPGRVRMYRTFRVVMGVAALLLIFVVTNRSALGAP